MYFSHTARHKPGMSSGTEDIVRGKPVQGRRIDHLGSFILFTKRTLSASEKAIALIALHCKPFSTCAMASGFLSGTRKNDSLLSLDVLCQMVLYFVTHLSM